MDAISEFVDIHGHYLPELDDGARTWQEAIAMARIAAGEGIRRLVVTPHQLGNYRHNHAELIRAKTALFQRHLDDNQIPIQVRPGADVRIEAELVSQVRCGSVLTLADHGRHVLLELPHELYIPLDAIIAQLLQNRITPVLSHPERNRGLVRTPKLVELLVTQGCLMQITASSLLGAFGEEAKQLAEWMVRQRLAHFVATDAHGSESRRPLIRCAYERVVALAGPAYACQICCENPLAVFEGRNVTVHSPTAQRRRAWQTLRLWRRAA